MDFNGILNSIKKPFQPGERFGPLISPVDFGGSFIVNGVERGTPKPTPMLNPDPGQFVGPMMPPVTPTPSPTPGPAYRNPDIDRYINAPGRKLKSDEMLSGAQIASEEYGIIPQLIADIGGLESNFGQWNRPFDNFPGEFASEDNARGPNMFLKSTAIAEGMDPQDRYSATESARAVGRKLLKGQLGEWDVVDLAPPSGKKLTDIYSEEELAPYSFNTLKRRQMLQNLNQSRIDEKKLKNKQ